MVLGDSSTLELDGSPRFDVVGACSKGAVLDIAGASTGATLASDVCVGAGTKDQEATLVADTATDVAGAEGASAAS